MAGEVFAYVALRPCGCVCQAATPGALRSMMKHKHFRGEMEAGRVRSIMTREEWDSLPWKCGVCRPEAKGGSGEQVP